MTTIPIYGSAQWCLLPPGDPRKLLARLVHSAACWDRLNRSPHVGEILAEFIEWDRRRGERLASHAVSKVASERRWFRPTTSYAEIERRRAEPGRLCLEFRERHGSEYLGGPVSWSTGKPRAVAA